MGTDCCDDSSAPDIGLPADLSERDQRILFELGCGDDLQVGFQGLRRRLDLHQESLRRSLRRLVDRGYVRRGRYGYGLTDHAWSAAGPENVSCRAGPAITLATTVLPAAADTDEVVDSLSKRWFAGLRWYGIAQGPGETTLVWQTDEGGLLRLRLGGGAARIQSTGSHAADDATVRHAATLLAAVADVLANAQRDPAASAKALASHGDWAA